MKKSIKTFPKHNNAIIFTRVASYQQTQKENKIETQKAHCLQFAKLLNLDVIKSFDASDLNKQNKIMKEIEKMISFAKTHNVNNIIVYSYDRFSRDSKIARTIIKKFEKIEINVLPVTKSKLTTNNKIQ